MYEKFVLRGAVIFVIVRFFDMLVLIFISLGA